MRTSISILLIFISFHLHAQVDINQLVNDFKSIRNMTLNAAYKNYGSLRGKSADFEGRYSIQKEGDKLMRFRSMGLLEVPGYVTVMEEVMYNGKIFYSHNFDSGAVENKGELYSTYKGEVRTRTSAIIFTEGLFAWYKELGENASTAIIENSGDKFQIILAANGKRGGLVFRFLTGSKMPYSIVKYALTGYRDDFSELTINSVRTDIEFPSQYFEVPGKIIHEDTTIPIGTVELLPVGKRAPDWELLNSDGERRTLSDYSGKVVILDFWATWCGPCIKAMPLMQSIHETYPDVAVLGMNYLEKVDINKFKEKKGLTYEMIYALRKTMSDYKVTVLPTLYVLDKAGNIVYAGTGSDGDDGTFMAAITAALR